MISLQIVLQARLFICGMAAGMVMVFVYDLLRIWRRVVSHGILWIAVEDIFYWCASAVGLFLLFYRQNDGKIRFFLLLSAFVGMCVYHRTFSPCFLKAGTFVLGKFVKGLCFAVKWSARPFRFFYKRAQRYSEKHMRKMQGRKEKNGTAAETPSKKCEKSVEKSM